MKVLIRGGGWGSYPQYCRAAYRGLWSPALRYYFVGFRLILITKKKELWKF